MTSFFRTVLFVIAAAALAWAFIVRGEDASSYYRFLKVGGGFLAGGGIIAFFEWRRKKREDDLEKIRKCLDTSTWMDRGLHTGLGPVRHHH